MVALSLTEAIQTLSLNKLLVDMPTFDRLDRALRRLETKADSSLSIDIQNLPDVLDTTLTALAEGKLPTRKVTKLMAMSGLVELHQQSDGELFVQKFLDLIVQESSAVYSKCLLIGYLKSVGINNWLSDKLRLCAKKNVDRLPAVWRRRVESYQLLEMNPGAFLAKEILSGSTSPRDLMVDAGLRGVLGGAGYARQVFNQVCDSLSEGHTDELLNRFWLFTNADAAPIFSESLSSYSKALLRPYQDVEASDDTRQLIQRFMTDTFKDPRMNQSSWSILPEEELAVLYRWLTKHSFDIILKVVEQSNDTLQWAERRQFWGKYIDAGHVTEAWAALGLNAASKARAMVQEGVLGSTKEFAVLETGVDRWHSVIMMRMGDFVITEWTHSGKVRFYNSRTNDHTPDFYKQRYSVDSYGKGLRNDQRTNFFKAHLGDWQHDVKQYISSNLGIRLQREKSRTKGFKSFQGKACHLCGSYTNLVPSWISDQMICSSCLRTNTKTR